MIVLIADDNANNRYLLRHLLESHGHHIETAENGHEALNMLGRMSFDLIVSDILMPGMDGFRLCREVKCHPHHRRIPFIFYTATYTDPKDEDLAMSLGADAFLVRPMDPDEFLNAIGQVIDRTVTEPHAPPRYMEPEANYLQQYNQRLINKLESRMEQLEHVGEELRREVLERRRSEMILRLAQRVGKMGSWKFDPGARTLACSEEALKILGLSPANRGPVHLESFLESIHDEDRDAVRASINGLGTRSGRMACNCRYRHPDGSLRHLALRAEAFSGDEADIVQLVGIVQDLTEPRQG